MRVHIRVYEWVLMEWAHLYHMYTLYAVFYYYFSAIANIAEALEISSGSRMELEGGMGS